MDRRLTALAICREALMVLTRELVEPTLTEIKEPARFDMQNPRWGVHYANFAIPEEDLGLCLGDFSDRYISPCMILFRRRLVAVPISDKFTVRPMGVDVANEAWNGVALRTIIDHRPIGDRQDLAPIAKPMQYYDIADDQLKTGPCAVMVHFTVCEPGCENPQVKAVEASESSVAAA